MSTTSLSPISPAPELAWRRRRMACLFAALVVVPMHPLAAQCTPSWIDTGFFVGTGQLPKCVRNLANGDLVVGTLGAVWRWNGTWTPIGSPSVFNGNVHAVIEMPNGQIVAAGDFTTMNGTAQRGIALWSGSAWTRIGTGTGLGDTQNPGVGRSLAVLSTGELVVGGTFGFINNIFIGGMLASWNGATWSPLGLDPLIAPNNYPRALAVLPNGDLCAGGDFWLKRRSGTVWTDMMPGVAPWIQALAVLPNGNLVAGGGFLNHNNVARWDGSVWSGLGTGANNTVTSLAVQGNGELVAIGLFTSIGGLSTSVARWNGSTWTAMNGGTSVPPGQYTNALAKLANDAVVAAVFPSILRWGCPGSPANQIVGTGCYLRRRSFYELFPSGTNDLTNRTVGMAMNAHAGYDVDTTLGATLTTPAGPGLGLGDNQVSAAISLPFTFDYPGGSTAQIVVDSNGCLLLNGTLASSTGGTVIRLMISARHRLCPSWQDLNPAAGGTVHAEPDPANPTTVFLVSWIGVPCFNATSPSTFQVALIDNGSNDRCEFRYQTLHNDSTSNGGGAITGFSLGAGQADPGNADLTAGPLATGADQLPVSLSATGRPVLGSSISLVTANIPANPGLSLLFLSASEINPGVDLGFLDMPGCRAYAQLPAFQEYLNIGAPTATTNLLVPGDQAMVGLVVIAQSGALAPGQNAFGVATSNGVRLTVGAF